jgi:hypothetical protein
MRKVRVPNPAPVGHSTEKAMPVDTTPPLVGNNAGSSGKEKRAMNKPVRVSAIKATVLPVWGSLSTAFKVAASVLVMAAALLVAIALGASSAEPSPGLNTHSIDGAVGGALPLPENRAAEFEHPDHNQEVTTQGKIVGLARLRETVRKGRKVARTNIGFARSQWWRDLLRRWRQALRSASGWMVNAAYAVAKHLRQCEHLRRLIRALQVRPLVAAKTTGFNWNGLLKAMALMACAALFAHFGHGDLALAAMAPVSLAVNDIIEYKDDTFVFLGTTPTGRAILAHIDGTPYKGNPALDKLTAVPAEQVGHTANSATNAPISGVDNAGNPGKEKRAMNKPVRVTLPTFEEHLSARRLRSPLAALVPSLLGCLTYEAIDERRPAFPEEIDGLPLILPWGAIALYGNSDILSELLDVFELGSNIGKTSTKVTPESIRKYIGSLFAAAHVSVIDLSDLGGKIINAADLDAHLVATGLDPKWSFRKAIDGEVLICRSLAKKLGWEEMKVKGHNSQVRRLVGPFGLIKGKIRIINDEDMPAGVAVITCETKGEIRLKVDKVLAWQPGFGLTATKTETITSAQAQLHILGNEMRSKAHLALTAKYFKNLLGRLPAILAGAESRLATADQPAGRKLQSAFNKVGLSVLASSSFAKSVAGTVSKYTDPTHLQVRPTTETTSNAWKVYPATSIYRLLAAAFMNEGQPVPAHIATAVKVINSLPRTINGKAVVLVQNWEEWAKGNTCPELIVGYRSPSGPTSGSEMVAMAMPEELKILDMADEADNLVIFGDDPEFWGLVDTPNEGADRDDAWRLDRCEGAVLAAKGLAWKRDLVAKLKSPAIQEQVGRLNAHIDAKLEQVRRNPDWKMAHARTVYGTVFNILKDAEGNPTGLAWRQAPEEEALRLPTNRGEEAELWHKVWGGEKSPFESAVGQIANAQKWAMALATGQAVLPERLAHLTDAVVWILGWAVVLSDVIDAAGKGRGYKEAHLAVNRMASTMLWLALHAYSNQEEGERFGMTEIGIANAGEAFKALMVKPAYTVGTGRYIDGEEIRRAPRTKDGEIVTAVEYQRMTSPLQQAHDAFHREVGKRLTEAAHQAWMTGPQDKVGLVLSSWLARPEVHAAFDGTDPVKWVAKAYHAIGSETGLIAESKERFTAYRRWVKSAPRSPKAIDQKLAWVRQPSRELLEMIQDEAVAICPDKAEIALRIAMLAYAHRFGFEDVASRPTTITSDANGRFEADGGLPPQALSGNREGTGPGDVLAAWLSMPETVAAIANVRAKAGSISYIHLRVGPSLRRLAKLEYKDGAPINVPNWHGELRFDPATLVGKTGRQVLSIMGITIFGEKEDPTMRELARVTDNHHETRRNRVKNAALAKTITSDERKDQLAELANLSYAERIDAAGMGGILANLLGQRLVTEVAVLAGNSENTSYEDNCIRIRFEGGSGVQEDIVEYNDEFLNEDFVPNADVADEDDLAVLFEECGFSPYED